MYKKHEIFQKKYNNLSLINTKKKLVDMNTEIEQKLLQKYPENFTC